MDALANARATIRALRTERDDAGYRAARLERHAAELGRELVTVRQCVETKHLEAVGEGHRADRAETALSVALHRQRDAEDSAANANTEADEMEAQRDEARGLAVQHRDAFAATRRDPEDVRASHVLPWEAS